MQKILPMKDAGSYHINPFDLTIVWPHSDYALIEVGEFELNRNPEYLFAEVKRSAFNPAEIVLGVSFSPDKILQARWFFYSDALHYRLDVNDH